MVTIQTLQDRYPNWKGFNKNLTRNYDILVVGGTDAYIRLLKTAYNPQKVLNLTLPDQSWWMSYECILHFFSIVKNGGRIIFVTSDTDNTSLDKSSALSFHHTILRSWYYPISKGIRRKVRLSWLFNPIWMLKCQGFNIGKSSIKSILEDQHFWENISMFCEEREIHFERISLSQIPDYFSE